MEQKQKEILTKIKQNKIKMKPKIYFVLGGILLGIGLGLTIILAVFAVNVGFYKFLFLGRFSERVIFLITLFIGAGILLLRQYEFSYKRDFAKLVGLLVAGILLLGLALSQTKINQKAQRVRHLRIIYQNSRPLPTPLRIHLRHPIAPERPTF